MRVGQNTLPEPPGLSPKAFAKRYGFGPATVYRWIQSGQIKAVRVGPRLLLIPGGEIQRILESGTTREANQP